MDLAKAIQAIQADRALMLMLGKQGTGLVTIETKNEETGKAAFWTQLRLTKSGLQTELWYGPDIKSDDIEHNPISLDCAIEKFGKEQIRVGLSDILKKYQTLLEDEKAQLAKRATEITNNIKTIDTVFAFLD